MVAIDSSSIRIEWETLPSVTSYEIFYSADDASVIRIEEVMEGSYFLQDLIPCIGYDFMVTPICNAFRGSFLETKIEIDNCSVNTSTNELPKEVEAVTIYPNPVSDFQWLSLSLKVPSKIEISLYATDGRKVYHHKNLDFLQGQHQIRLEYPLLASGIYLLYIQTETGQFVRRIIR